MKVGFTGSRAGMTAEQKDGLVGALGLLGMNQFHHGDCVGSDAEAHELVRLHFPRARIILHPPTSDEHRAWKEADEARKEMHYLTRNRMIVMESDCLIAAPDGPLERIRSGTWTTVRYARKEERSLMILFPDGQVTTEKWG